MLKGHDVRQGELVLLYIHMLSSARKYDGSTPIPGAQAVWKCCHCPWETPKQKKSVWEGSSAVLSMEPILFEVFVRPGTGKR